MARYDEATFRLAQELRRKSAARLREAGKDLPDRKEAGPQNFRAPVDEQEPVNQQEASAQRVIALAAWNAAVAAYPPDQPQPTRPREGDGTSFGKVREAIDSAGPILGTPFHSTRKSRLSDAQVEALLQRNKARLAVALVESLRETALSDAQVESLLQENQAQPFFDGSGLLHIAVSPASDDAIAQARARLAQGDVPRPEDQDGRSTPRRASRPAGE